MTGVVHRCEWAIKYGIVLHTRCVLDAGHDGLMHEGRGLEEFPYQTIQWLKGDRREYITTRDAMYAWEES